MTARDIADFYGRWAGLYDRLATAPGVARWRRAAAERTATEGDVVVEMGCGTGANLPYLGDRVGPDGYVIGVDIARPLLDRARDRVDGYDNVAVVRGDATVPPIARVDAVLATFVCGLLSDPAGVVDRWCKVIGPGGGRVAVLDATTSDDPRGRPLNPLFRAFVAAGAPDGGLGDVLSAPFGRFDEPLTRRVEASRTALADRTVDRTFETFGLGFVGLFAGTVEAAEIDHRAG
ncbi:class I SAM-dependent methyltransferase [Natronomonas salsuginis]|jgi:ubiquinone/menaquinone biosynthesis C-methylase UbiE|uniref:Methyltransferase domain-containing protein n=1 Tax=Natronomonas salsuginis TaxID=2217661 RepID=A0A4U5JCW9_9EURY|nr:methyltransferase domain-containing protein [Natronomonas salsuginis]TKR25728.1 methyltransferase domain-containing protein [Natronomonas salsuginis]